MLDQDGRPLRLTWNYTRAEIIADGIIHAIGVSLGIAGAVVLVLLTIHAAGGVQTASALIYAIRIGCTAWLFGSLQHVAGVALEVAVAPL